MFSSIPSLKKRTLTPDRGFEFAYFKELENTNGLIREYLPKRTVFTEIPEEYIDLYTVKINLRPRKCLGYKTPFEVFNNELLHLKCKLRKKANKLKKSKRVGYFYF